ncbi:hypothetical protein HAX54_008645, partial [Datura stramonium]|nr:hypothetical protein [Datura stramonium]
MIVTEEEVIVAEEEDAYNAEGKGAEERREREIIATVLYDIRPCVMDELLKELRLSAKSSYCLEQYRCNEGISTVVRPRQGQVTVTVRPKQCAGQPLRLSW